MHGAAKAKKKKKGGRWDFEVVVSDWIPSGFNLVLLLWALSLSLRNCACARQEKSPHFACDLIDSRVLS